MKFSKFGTLLILLVPIGLVAGPVLWGGIRTEVAHWYLAAAANSIELGKGSPDKSLESARAWDPEVSSLHDYWTVRLRQLSTITDLTLMDVLKEVPEERKPEIAEKLANQYGSKGDFAQAANVMRVLLGEKANQSIIYWDVMISQAIEEDSAAKGIELLREAISKNLGNSDLRIILARQYAIILSNRDEFTASLEAYKIWFGEKYDRDTMTLNALAYGRALANVELEQALIDIDEAIGYRPEDPDLRDTRAWVYYQLGRYDDALTDADFAVKTKESPSITNWLQSLMGTTVATAQRHESTTTSKDTLPRNEFVPGPEQVAETVTSGTDPPVVMLDPPKEYLKQSNTSILTWSRGVVRCHRAKILEKLGRTEEANADWQWIEENRLPPDDRLH